MEVLKPVEAAYAADNVYRIITETDVPRYFHTSLLDKFDLGKSTRFEGTAGAMLLRYKFGFGVVAKGKGEFQ